MSEARRRFRFNKELAQGGFGKVYLAEMLTGENFSSTVAVKLLHARWGENAEVVMRSRDEARLLGRLRHRNIVRVEALTRIQGQVAIVMEYLEGADLKAIASSLRDSGRAYPRQAAFEVISYVAAALDAAYNQVPINASEPLRVIHRDIKPSNVMITVEGDVKVLDFGTARASFDTREAKTQALAFGSAAYMSPERLMGEEDTPAADVFALGLTLWEILTQESFGKIPVRPERFEAVVADRVASVDLSSLPDVAQEQVRDALRRMLAYEPSARPTAAEVTEQMETFAEGCRDGGLKRFARECVKDVVAQATPDPDPQDPLTGAVLFEDTSTIQETTGIHPVGQGWTEDTSDGYPAQGIAPPPTAPPLVNITLAAPLGSLDAPSEEAPRPVPSVVVAPVPALPPAPAPVPALPPVSAAPVVAPEPVVPSGPADFRALPRAPLAASPTMLPDEDFDDGATVVARPSAAPRPVVTVAPAPAVDVAKPTPSIVATPQPAHVAPPATKGGNGRVLGIVAIVVLAVGGVGAWFALGGGAETPPEAPADTPAAPGEPMVSGEDVVTVVAPAEGRGSVVLQVPGGAERVVISSLTADAKVNWDGTKSLYLRDREAGALRVNVTRTGKTPDRGTVQVTLGKTCRYAYQEGASEPWVLQGACE